MSGNGARESVRVRELCPSAIVAAVASIAVTVLANLAWIAPPLALPVASVTVDETRGPAHPEGPLSYVYEVTCWRAATGPLDDRFALNGNPTPLCARMVGIVVGLLVAFCLVAAVPLVRIRLAPWGVWTLIGATAAASLPMAVDWALQLAGVYHVPVATRLPTGFMFGTVAGAAAMTCIIRSLVGLQAQLVSREGT